MPGRSAGASHAPDLVAASADARHASRRCAADMPGMTRAHRLILRKRPQSQFGRSNSYCCGSQSGDLTHDTDFSLSRSCWPLRRPERRRARARADDRIRTGDAAQPPGRTRCASSPARSSSCSTATSSSSSSSRARRRPGRRRSSAARAAAATAIRAAAAGLSAAAAGLPAAGYPQQAYPPQQDAYPPGPPPAGGRRGDAFDPNQNPNAPGVPRTLGGPGAVAAAPPLDNQASDEEPYVGAPGGRQAGAPLDLGIMAEEAANAPPIAPRGAPDSRRAAASAAAQSERHRRRASRW